MAGGAASLLSACSSMPGAKSASSIPRSQRVEPFLADREHLMKVTVCTRPFRPKGPRLELERFGEKTVVHNYGHGGSGWSLSWGCAAEATMLARSKGAKEFAVIGAGVIGLTTALQLIETGAAVTIFADEFPAETRSARATGVWSPSSRIGLADRIPSGFAERWERWARASHARHIQ
ncbi:MAG: FAD-dependent oxidoreductase, partial [Pseudomonadota bacterium]